MPFLIIHNRSTLGHQVIVQVRLANLTIELEVQWVSVLASDPLLSAASSQASQVTSSLGSAPQSALQRRELSHILQWTLLAVTCFAQFQIPNAFRHCGDLLAKGTSLNNARKLSSTIPSPQQVNPSTRRCIHLKGFKTLQILGTCKSKSMPASCGISCSKLISCFARPQLSTQIERLNTRVMGPAPLGIFKSTKDPPKRKKYTR